MNEHDISANLLTIHLERAAFHGRSELHRRVRDIQFDDLRQQRRWWQLPTVKSESMFNATKFVVAGAIVALFGGFLLAGVLTQQPAEDRLPVAGGSATATALIWEPDTDFQELGADATELVPRTAYLIPDLVVLGVPTSGWVHQPHIGRWTIEKARDASASFDMASDHELNAGSARITIATSTPVALYAAPCRYASDEPLGRGYQPVHESPIGSDRADLAAVVAAIPGVEVVQGPTEVIVGDLPATHVTVRVPSDAACPLFDLWDDWTRDRRQTNDLGNSIGVWIVDYPRFEKRYWIVTETRDSTSPELVDETEQIVDHIGWIG